MPETYRAIAETETDAEAPLTSDLFKALDKNVAAAGQGSNGAPINEYGWHPYNKVFVGDSFDGVIWSFNVNGAVAAITPPDFTDDYEYAFLYDRATTSAATAQTFTFNFFKETSGFYSGFIAISGSLILSASIASSQLFVMRNVRKVRGNHWVTTENYASDSGTDTVQTIASSFAAARVSHATPQKILRVQLSTTNGVITGPAGSKITMLKRRAF